jgi:hypothetical protein
MGLTEQFVTAIALHLGIEFVANLGHGSLDVALQARLVLGGEGEARERLIHKGLHVEGMDQHLALGLLD